jgi:hypothetical protein
MRTRDDILGAHMPKSAATVWAGTIQGENVSA